MLTITKLLNLANLDSLRFGIVAPSHSERLPIETCVGNIDNLPALSWSTGCSPCEAQQLTSCGANATANLLENQIFRVYGLHVTIDADRIYHAALERYHRTNTLMLGQAAETCYSLGLLTEDCAVRYIPSSFYEIYEALKEHPLIVAHNISEGWRPANLTEEGIIRDDWATIPSTGHATLLVAYAYFNGDAYAILQNSWGTFPPMNGLMALSLGRFLRDLVDDPVAITFGPMWKLDRTWEKFVIEDPKWSTDDA